ncbi:MAG: hypothetical protein V7L27_30460 [Nostoc sp.]|uniref:hypothetical protein n=1 Tax=Nostoc sp. TaxID=1180 RepID=UPI002FF958BE
MNRRQDNNQSFVLTAIYRVFSDLEFSSKNLNRTVLRCLQICFLVSVNVLKIWLKPYSHAQCPMPQVGSLSTPLAGWSFPPTSNEFAKCLSLVL